VHIFFPTSSLPLRRSIAFCRRSDSAIGTRVLKKVREEQEGESRGQRGVALVSDVVVSACNMRIPVCERGIAETLLSG